MKTMIKSLGKTAQTKPRGHQLRRRFDRHRKRYNQLRKQFLSMKCTIPHK